MPENREIIIPRQIPEGTVPLVSIEGTARDCGREYTQIMLEKYPHYTTYFQKALQMWRKPDTTILKLFEKHAPHVIDIYDGILDIVKGRSLVGVNERIADGCTSFSVSPSLTLDNIPISGQTKDTGIDSAALYIVLRMRIKDAPTILTLAYPGEILGYGMWSTGMTVFRNSLHSSAGSDNGLDIHQWGLLALAQDNVAAAADLALAHGLRDSGNVLVSDGNGASVSFEFNCGGIDIIRPQDGISVHANHPAGPDTGKYENYPNPVERENSRFRSRRLYELLQAEKGRLTAQKALEILANHDGYPLGICRHIINDKSTTFTTAAVVAEPTKGLLHVTRGNPCSNWPVTYEI